jgi:hypothetical protein
MSERYDQDRIRSLRCHVWGSSNLVQADLGSVCKRLANELSETVSYRTTPHSTL